MKFSSYKLCLTILLTSIVWSVETSNVNLTLDENGSARNHALAKTSIGLPGDAASLESFPSAMNDVDELSVLLNHASVFSKSSYHNLSVTVPFDANSTFGLGFTRFGTNDIPLYPNLSPESGENKKFNIADYVLSASFARLLLGVDVGGRLSLLYRELDQIGMGIRGDLSIRYVWKDRVYLGGLYKGLLPSSARWESDHVEIEPLDLHLGAGIQFSGNYIYGTFRSALQTQGLFQKRAKSQSGVRGSRIYENPGDIAKTLSLAMEYNLNLGLNFRIGVLELGNIFSDFIPSLGLGYRFKNIITVDYAFSSHVELPNSHRITLTFVPRLKGSPILRPQDPNRIKPSNIPGSGGPKIPSGLSTESQEAPSTSTPNNSDKKREEKSVEEEPAEKYEEESEVMEIIE